MKNDVFVNIHLSPYHKMVMQEMAVRFGYNSISAFAFIRSNVPRSITIVASLVFNATPSSTTFVPIITSLANADMLL